MNWWEQSSLPLSPHIGGVGVCSQTLFKLDLSYFIAMPIITLGFLWKFPELWMWDKFTLNFSFHGKVLKQFCHHFWHWAREWKSKRLTNIAVETQGPASQYSQIQSNSNFMWTFLTDRQGWIHNEIQKCLFFLSRICFSLSRIWCMEEMEEMKTWEIWRTRVDQSRPRWRSLIIDQE